MMASRMGPVMDGVFECCFCSCRSGKESDSEAEDLEHAEKLRHVKAVLEEVWSLNINFKFN